MKKSKEHKWYQVNRFLFVPFVFILFLTVPNYHFVTGINAWITPVQRPYWGFSDIIADIQVCTTGPFIAALSQHPSLCKALQNSGFLESTEAFTSRVSQDASNRMTKYSQCVAKCDITSTDYLSCSNSCL